MGFYKIYGIDENGEYVGEDGKKVTILYAPNFVYAKEYELLKKKHEEYAYPVDGWYWFDSEKEMMAAFGVSKVEKSSELDIT